MTARGCFLHLKSIAALLSRARSGAGEHYEKICPVVRFSFVELLNNRRSMPATNENTATIMDSHLIPCLLLFRNSGPENYQHLSPEQRQQLMMRWNAWYDDLAAQGKAIEGQPLELETRLVSGPGGSRIIDGPFAEAKEAIGGYVKLLAGSIEEATAIAQRHPGLEYGLCIEVRQLSESCHLGVTAGHRAAPALSGV
jgi:hypothetical protein